LTPSEFDSEEKLHDLVESSPGLLPLSGNPSMVVLGREVQLGPGYADLLAVETDGRLVVIEIKLRKNAETRRAVVAQVLTYAAYLKGLGVLELERTLRSHLDRVEARSILDLVRKSDQSQEVEEAEFSEGLAESLTAGASALCWFSTRLPPNWSGSLVT
jgi:CRISPR/Cas system-associated exonuclease Cas4 (RecB family)